jgi:hypothetical protein
VTFSIKWYFPWSFQKIISIKAKPNQIFKTYSSPCPSLKYSLWWSEEAVWIENYSIKIWNITDAFWPRKDNDSIFSRVKWGTLSRPIYRFCLKIVLSMLPILYSFLTKSENQFQNGNQIIMNFNHHYCKCNNWNGMSNKVSYSNNS